WSGGVGGADGGRQGVREGGAKCAAQRAGLRADARAAYTRLPPRQAGAGQEKDAGGDGPASLCRDGDQPDGNRRGGDGPGQRTGRGVGVDANSYVMSLVPYTMARLTSSMASVTWMPRGQASAQLKIVRQRQTPVRSLRI